VYCYHEIVHNQRVVQRFEAQGVVFVDDIVEVPPGRPVMLSAHGSAPEVVVEATERGKDVARRFERVRHAQLSRALASWTDEEREQLGMLLIRLVEDLQSTPYLRSDRDA
jgi:hypothetical protein